MRSSFEVSGLDEYLDALDKAGKDVDLIARSALAEAGKMLQLDMIARVNVVTGEHTQNIIDHIQIKTPSGEGHYNYVQVGIIGDAAFTDKETAIQAVAIEFGSVHNAAMPFIRPAIRANKSRINQLIRARLSAAGLVD